ncbi:MAG: SprT family zinc-dependent metalloprotease [Eubacteriales bacterium]|nr:SprT family zinc-dependent metalloprotease [Eubacteriales bacterium]
MNLTIDSFTVHVTRKKIENLYLRVLPQEGVVINAPMYTTDAEIARFVRSRADWIDQQQEKLALIVPRGYGDGDAVPYFGKNLTLRLIACTGRTHIALRGDALELTIRRDASEEARKKAVDAWYKKELYEAAGAMLPAVERTVGRRAGELKVRDMKTRWGTCNTRTALITLNLRLVERPAECLRYVLTHELCHLHEAGHGERFWKRMDVYYPDWKRVRKLLKQRT